MTSTPAMNTAALKKFATESRTQLLDQMRVRIGQVLTDSRAELEHPTAVALLKKAVADRGIEAVTEEAAYTWFNRLTAARYMDVNGFSGMYQVVSPAEGSASALPEILAQARAGNFDSNVGDEARQAVSDLLSGQRQSDNPDFEAYAILLRTVFHTWHGVLPSVFPASVDWVELLIPIDMLTPTAVRSLATGVMDTATCTDVEVVGWLYQFYISDRKDQINDSKVKITAAEIGPVTQLFTPHWIVRYLVENSLGRLWLRSKPNSGLRSSMDYYVDPVEGKVDDGVTVAGPEEIRLIDPACGSGHILTYAFDLLYAIYEEEGYAPSDIPSLILNHNLAGTEIDPRAAQLASFALAMKARGRDRRFFTRNIHPRIALIEPTRFTDDDIQAIVTAYETFSGASRVDGDRIALLLRSFEEADTLGSLIRVDTDAVTELTRCVNILGTGPNAMFTSHLEDPVRALLHKASALVDEQYQVVVANPPYLGSGNMGDPLRQQVTKDYPDAKADLLTAFMVRATELTVAEGVWGMIVLPSWMSLKTFADFRKKFLNSQRIDSFLHLGRGLFGSDYGSVAFSITNKTANKDHKGVYRRLFEEHVQVRKPEVIESLFFDSTYNRFEMHQGDFQNIPESPIVYWLSDKAGHAFNSGTKLGEISSTRTGLCTGNNEMFIRNWFEPSANQIGFLTTSREEAATSGNKWFPYNKGGSFRRWWGNQELIVNWKKDGSDIRAYDAGNPGGGTRIQNEEFYFKDCVSWSNISSGAPSFRRFPKNSLFDQKGRALFADDSTLNSLLGFLNSSVATELVKAVSPTVSLNSGEVSKLPVLPVAESKVGQTVEKLVKIFREDWDAYETSWDFSTHPLVAPGEGLLEKHAERHWLDSLETTEQARNLEETNNRYFAELYDLEDEVECAVPLSRISLTANPYFRYAPTKGTTRTEAEYKALFFRDVAKELISYAVGCMMGRYSLDRSGLVLTDAGDTLEKFNQLVPVTRFQPDDDGILPITEGEYFPDDITARFREFLAVAFGTDAVKANIAWIEEALTIGAKKSKTIEDYFLNDFYDDHVQAYSKRPIYWQFSSPKKGFNALVYLHRYTPATIGLIHQNYAEEHLDKLQARLDTITHALPSADKRDAVQFGKERDTIVARIREIRSWVDDVLFRMSTERIALDLDDGVKVNYPKLAGAVKKVTGL